MEPLKKEEIIRLLAVWVISFIGGFILGQLAAYDHQPEPLGDKVQYHLGYVAGYNSAGQHCFEIRNHRDNDTTN